MDPCATCRHNDLHGGLVCELCEEGVVEEVTELLEDMGIELPGPVPESEPMFQTLIDRDSAGYPENYQ